MKKLKHTLGLLRNFYEDTLRVSESIENRLHNFSYIWVAYITGIIILFFKIKELFIENIPSDGLYLFFGYQVIGIIYISYIFFRIYVYEKNYNINSDHRAYISMTKNKDKKLSDLINAEIDVLQKCIDNNSSLNDYRLKNLSKAKKLFRNFLLGNIILLTLILTSILLR